MYSTVPYGVPQGSTLGPLLFLIYINDISSLTELCDLYMFADDSSVFISHDDLKQLTAASILVLRKVNEWFSSNRLTVNYSKTHFMLFAPKVAVKTEPGVNLQQIVFDNITIKGVQSCKFLGVQIDDKLTFSEHIQSIIAKLKSTTALMYKSRNVLNNNCKKILFHSLV